MWRKPVSVQLQTSRRSAFLAFEELVLCSGRPGSVLAAGVPCPHHTPQPSFSLRLPSWEPGQSPAIPPGLCLDTVGPFLLLLSQPAPNRGGLGETLSAPWPQTLACPPPGTTGLGWVVSPLSLTAYCFAGGGGGTAGSPPGRQCTAGLPTAGCWSSGLGLQARTRPPGGAACSGRWQQRESRSGHAGRRCAWGVAQEARS